MRIGISGASGHFGAATLAYVKALAPDAEIIGISRTPQSISLPGAGARFGDYDDPASLREAYRGLDKVLLIPTTDLRPGVRARQTIGAVEAAVAESVGHVVYVSSVGTRNVPEPHVWAGYYATEQAMFAKAKNWTVLRMAYYIESFIDEVRQSIGLGMHAALADTPVNFVSRDDLAAAAAGILTTEGHAGAIYQGTGAECFTATERARLVAEASGKPFHFVQVSEEQYAGGLRGVGLPEDVVNTVLAIQNGFATGGFDIISGDVARLSGRQPKSLKDALTSAF